MRHIVMIAVLTSMVTLHAMSPRCEKAIVTATKIGMKFANTGTGYRAMIAADNNVTKVCKD